MQAIIFWRRDVAWVHRLIPATIALGLLLVIAFAQSAAAQSGAAQSADGPLNFGNNFFVTGDYVVAGAQNMTTQFSNGFAVGTISIPDTNPGIRGANTVPKGAQIVAALLYWQTVEKSSVVPGQPGSGEKGFFRPVFKDRSGPPQPGYPITGVNLAGNGTVSFSTGGCTSTSTGKLVRTYRADVRGFLPLDANGNVLVDSADNITFEVRLPSSTNTTPITLGATLVLIYRVISPNFLLNSIVIYDGAFAPSSSPFTMTQTVRGFYDAASGPVSRLTHIVGNGKSKKFETVSLGATALPSLYGSGETTFPGYYGSWDNPTWAFPDKTFDPVNPVSEHDASVTTMIGPGTMNPGCVASAAVIFSTTVHDDNKDGILQVWKNNQGYTDVATGQFVSLADVTDPPTTHQQDIFIQMDHVVDSSDFTPDPVAVSMVKNAFLANGHNIHLHITDASKITGIAGANAIQEPGCTDKPSNSPPEYCQYPKQPGITTWRYGFEFVKNQPLNYPDESSCESATNPPCVRRFPIAQRNSHHYVVIGDTLGAANWTFLGGILTDSAGNKPGLVAQVNNVVTFYTSKGHGLTTDNVQHTLANGRVTVSNAITNANLNGTFFVTSVNCPPNPDPNGKPCDVTNKAAGLYSFTISIGGSAVTANYSLKTDPNLAFASGQAGSGSGLSDVGGMGTLVTLGKWGTDATLSAKAGTLMHELGHPLGLAIHGGSYYDNLAPGQNIPDYRPTIEANCKSNYQSVMNYMFQTRLLGNGVVDFSNQQLSPLSETSLGPITTTDPQIAFTSTDWYDTKQTLVIDQNGNTVPLGATATHHCDDTPLNSTDPPTYFYQGGISPSHPNELDIPWSNTVLDANFDGTVPSTVPPPEPPFRGYDDWANLDLRQVGAAGSSLLGQGGLFSGPGGLFSGPGGFFSGPGGLFSGPGGFFSGPGGLFSGPGGFFSGPGGLFSGPGEIDLRNALSVTPAPTSLSASEGPAPPSPYTSPRTITLTWTEPNFPATEKNNIYRSSGGGTFTFIAFVSGTTPGTPNTFTDTVTCNPNGYSYFVTTVTLNTTLNPQQDQESTQSNTVSAGQSGQPLTGCYTPSSPLFASPVAGSSPLAGSIVAVKWTVQDASNNAGTFANNPASNSLVAIGPISNDVMCVSSTANPPLNTPRPTISAAGAGITFNPNTNQFSFNWNTAQGFPGSVALNLPPGAFPPGCYRLELDLDSGQPKSGNPGNLPLSAFQVQFYLSDSNESVLVNNTSPLTAATVGIPYIQQLQETGGVIPLSWTVVPNSGSLPTGFNLDPALGKLSGTTLTAGTFQFTLQVMDSIMDFGTQPLALTVHIFVSDSQPPANPPFTATTALPNAVVGSPYSNIVYESGGVSNNTTAFSWTIVPNSVMPGGGSTLPGVSFQPNAIGVTNGTLSGTPTAPGTYTFTAMVTDSAGNTGTQTLTLNVADALFGRQHRQYLCDRRPCGRKWDARGHSGHPVRRR
jgi:hypothetical protein